MFCINFSDNVIPRTNQALRSASKKTHHEPEDWQAANPILWQSQGAV